MLDKALQIVAPHLCFGCGKIGTALCPSCKYSIIDEQYSGCLYCGLPATNGVCKKHSKTINSAWIVGERDDILRKLIDAYKFERARSIHKDLADLLTEVLPALPDNIIVTAIPTIRAHIRERGYDHAELIAKSIATQRRVPYYRLLKRTTTTRQRGASRRQRHEQAKEAFITTNTTVPSTVLLVDDVVTTGATLHFAAKALKDSGVKTIFVAVVAKQPIVD